MISLTSCLVSIEDFIDLSYIIKNFCVDKQPKDFVLPTSIITLCMGLLDQLFAVGIKLVSGTFLFKVFSFLRNLTFAGTPLPNA